MHFDIGVSGVGGGDFLRGPGECDRENGGDVGELFVRFRDERDRVRSVR